MPKRTPLGLGGPGARAARCRGLPGGNRGWCAPVARPGPGHQLAQIRKQLGLGQKQIAAAMGVGVARVSVSQIDHGEVISFEVIARYVKALGGRLDLVADFGDRTVRCPSPTPLPPHNSKPSFCAAP